MSALTKSLFSAPHKECFVCRQIKPKTDFYKHYRMADGHVNKCKECNKSHVRKNRRDKISYYKEYDKSRAMRPDRVEARKRYIKTPAGKKSKRAAVLKWIERNPEKRAAHNLINLAIKNGTIKKRPCHICGSVKAHAHHDDYSKPLEVIWLCPRHHKERHDLMKTTPRLS